MPRCVYVLGLGVSILALVAVIRPVLHNPADYQREQDEAVKRAVQLYALLGAHEAPVSAVPTVCSTTSGGYAYLVTEVDIYDRNGTRLASVTADLFSGEIIKVTCAIRSDEGGALSEAQAYEVARERARALGMMAEECPWKLVSYSENIPSRARFCWAAGRHLLRVCIDRANSHLIFAETRKLNPNGYMPH